MRALGDVIGLPVVNLRTGEVVGEIAQLHWDEPTGEITGIAVSGANGLVYVPFDAVARVGNDAVFIESCGKDQLLPEQEPRSLRGLAVYDQNGDELGSVDDLIVDLAQGKVSGLNVSGGLLRDIVQGRQFIPWASAHLGKDTVIVGDTPADREDGEQR